MAPNVPQFPVPPAQKLDVLANRIAEQRERATRDAAEAAERRRRQEEQERQAEEVQK